jgi:hypothetical protein
MSAPNTNIDRQKQRHRWPLIGIGAAMLFGALIAVLIAFDATGDAGSTPPEGAVDAAPAEAADPATAPAN